MRPFNILFKKQVAIKPETITERIDGFGDKYNEATKEIIHRSRVLDREGAVFIECASHILSSFGMTRSGRFKGKGKAGKKNKEKILSECWSVIGGHLLKINNEVLKSGLSRDRYLLELSEPERAQVIAKVWYMTKQLLHFTMGKTSHGLVGASKILFSVLPEIVLPVDTNQWYEVFRTVDLGDVIIRMVSEIKQWEKTTNRKLNELDPKRRLTTLPAVYNVMAMAARPKSNSNKAQSAVLNQSMNSISRNASVNTGSPEFKNAVFKYAGTLSQYDAMKKAARELEIQLPPSYLKYPGSHIHQWRKQGFPK